MEKLKNDLHDLLRSLAKADEDLHNSQSKEHTHTTNMGAQEIVDKIKEIVNESKDLIGQDAYDLAMFMIKQVEASIEEVFTSGKVGISTAKHTQHKLLNSFAHAMIKLL